MISKKIGLLTLSIFTSFVLLSCGNDDNNIESSSNAIYSSISTSSSLNTNNYTREGNKIYFGRYPQTKVEATNDNGLALISYDLTWTSYRYYVSSEQSDYMCYKDIDIDDDGIFDYRGVHFSGYRPSYYFNSSYPGSHQDSNNYIPNRIYWFKYEKIEWDILEEENGKAMIISNLLLDSQDYYPSKSEEIFSHNGDEGYANNYELSNIRIWLNDNFYNTAFDDLQKEIIEITEVDNSLSSTFYIEENNYVCNNTQDKMFLLSYQEAAEAYTTIEARKAKGTDYAKCQGLHVVPDKSIYSGNSEWWLRSPYFNSANHTYYVNYMAGFSQGYVYGSYVGVRPACWITLI